MGEPDDIMSEILSGQPSRETAFIVLTRMKQEGRLREVVGGCLDSLRVYPHDIRLRSLMAESYLEMGLMGQAVDELEKITSMISNLVPAYKSLAEIYARQQRPAEAARAIKTYLTHRPDDRMAHELLDRLGHSEGTPASVKGPYDDLDSLSDETEDAAVDFATSTIAEIYYDQGQLSEAISTYEKIIRSDPHNDDAISRLAELKADAVRKTNTRNVEKNRSQVLKKRLITILERWLPKVKEIRHAR